MNSIIPFGAGAWLFIGLYLFMLSLIIIGVYFRGENWAIAYPWVETLGGGH